MRDSRKWEVSPGVSNGNHWTSSDEAEPSNRSALIDHACREKTNPTESTANYFFDHEALHPFSTHDVLRALIKQCFSTSEPLTAATVSWARELRHSLLKTNSVVALQELTSILSRLLSETTKKVFVIDGYDGLNEEELRVFFELFRKLDPVLKRNGCQVAFFGREILGKGIDIRKQLSACQIDIGLSDLKADIEAFVDYQVESFHRERTLTENHHLIDEIKAALKTKSGNM